mmetsp:Transcript_21446/g.59974  ORF Transcript_21446/g.59974 Transcript_21446/m.59974 type:complete len:99 (+) Transcript_21446:66-362(+)
MASSFDTNLQCPIHSDHRSPGFFLLRPVHFEAVGSGTAKTCNNCGVVGHLAGACPEPAQCHACGSTSHAVAECPNRDKVCDNCGKVGHLKVKCRKPVQ